MDLPLRSRLRAHHRTSRSERGALLVEFGLIAPLLVMLILGTITTGLNYNRQTSLNNSARETARFGATLPIEGDLEGWLNSVADVAINAATGDLPPSAAGQEVCVAYVHPDGGDANDRTLSIIERQGSRSLLAGIPCFTDSRADSERRVQVSVGRDSTVTFGVYSSDSVLAARSVAGFERVSQ